MFKFNIKYLLLTVLLLAVEIIIAVYFHDDFIRPHVGDFLVVLLLYCLVKSFLNSKVWLTALAVLIFSYAIETLQYFHIVNILGLEKSKIACTIIGTSFEWTDILAYTLGILLVLVVEKANKPSKRLEDEYLKSSV